jgi:hypothetical protein
MVTNRQGDRHSQSTANFAANRGKSKKLTGFRKWLVALAGVVVAVFTVLTFLWQTGLLHLPGQDTQTPPAARKDAPAALPEAGHSTASNPPAVAPPESDGSHTPDPSGSSPAKRDVPISSPSPMAASSAPRKASKEDKAVEPPTVTKRCQGAEESQQHAGKLIADGKPGEALRVLEAGLDTCPNDRGLKSLKRSLEESERSVSSSTNPPDQH